MKFYYRLMIETVFEARQVARARYSKFLTWHFLEMQEVEQKSNWWVHVLKEKTRMYRSR